MNNTLENAVNEFISLIHTDGQDDNSFLASQFVDKYYESNSKECIEMLRLVFRMQSYRYADEVISAIRFSDIDYIQDWFRELLLEGKTQPDLTDFINDLLELYQDEFAKIGINIA